jgi:hypothetical protein
LALGARGADSIIVQPAYAPHTDVDVVVPSTRPIAGLDELSSALEAMTHGGATVLRWDHERRSVITPPHSAIAAS